MSTFTIKSAENTWEIVLSFQMKFTIMETPIATNQEKVMVT